MSKQDENRPYGETRRVLFVCRGDSTESVRSAQALAGLENVEVFLAGDFGGGEELADIARSLRNKHGSIERIVTAQETLLEAVAIANEVLGLPGLSVAAVRRTLDKSLFKSALQQADINTPRYQLIEESRDAEHFIHEIGFPIVLKSAAGSGALATFLIRTADDLVQATALAKNSSAALIAEEYIHGQELCIDTITINSEPQFHSICCYEPSILEAVEHPETQWSCVMPRDMSPYHDFIDQGLKAIKALVVGNAMTHMEGFIDSSGRPWFTDATLRPAGARIAPMLAHAYDIDPYRAWARVAIDGCFDGPLGPSQRKYAVGTIFLNGAGTGSVVQVQGIDLVQHEFKNLLVDARWPRIGAHKSATYTGDGFVTVRHRDTEVVQEALHKIGQLIRITYSSHSQPAVETWEQRLHNFRELNRPAWDQPN